jgi:photosystem II stability/assembly factor-like uncharacterized protein
MIRKQLFIFTIMFFVLVAEILYAGPNQWTLTEGMYPIGGYHMSLCPSDNNIVYTTGGIRLSPQYLYKSIDRGNTWSQISNINTYWYYVYAAPENSSTIYLINGISPGVYKSTDGGSTVTLYTTGISSTAIITDLCITDTTGTLLLGAGFVYKSTDGGETWSPASTGMGKVDYIKFSISPVNASLIYATGGNGLYKTIDGGNHWSLLTSSSNFYEWDCIRVSSVNPDIVYAIPGSYYNNLYKSTDGGITWSLKTTGLPAMTYLDIATVPGDGSTLFITSPNNNGGVYISTDTGETWQEMNNGFSAYPPYIVQLLVIPGKSPIILAATDKGIYSYTLTTTSVDKKLWEAYEEKK